MDVLKFMLNIKILVFRCTFHNFVHETNYYTYVRQQREENVKKCVVYKIQLKRLA